MAWWVQWLPGMKITSAKRTALVTTAQATIGGQRFEYTSHKGGAWEVYDYPKRYRGVPRFCGYMPEDAGKKLEVIIRRHFLL